MVEYFDLPKRERADILAAAADELGLPPGVLEKDIWICWALEQVFAMPDAPPMAFKGGTSLSKVFNAIRRFSEDVDISVDYRSLSDIPEDLSNLSSSQTKKLSENLRRALSCHVATRVLPWLEDAAERRFGKEAVRFARSADGDRIDLIYPDPIIGELEYLAPRVIL